MPESLVQRFASTEVTSLVLTDAFVVIGDRLGTPVSGMAEITPLKTLLDASITQLIISSDVILERDAANILALRNSTTSQTLRVYTTWTDISNRENLAITGAAITVETAGTGTDNIDLTLTPAGTGVLKFGSHTALGGESVSGFITIKDSGGASRKIAVVT